MDPIDIALGGDVPFFIDSSMNQRRVESKMAPETKANGGMRL
jgi:hypothetical protein